MLFIYFSWWSFPASFPCNAYDAMSLISVTLQEFSDFCFMIFGQGWWLHPSPITSPPACYFHSAWLPPHLDLGWNLLLNFNPSWVGRKRSSVCTGEKCCIVEKGAKQCVEWCGTGVSIEVPSPGLPTSTCDTRSSCQELMEMSHS